MRELIIMQGIPGAGKGFVIKRDYFGGKVCSADNYFRKKNEDYDKGGVGFDPKLLGEAHNGCFKSAMNAMKEENPIVIIDNTNLDNESISPYVALGNAFNYDITICRVSCDYKTAAKRNTHGVPERVYGRMANAFSRWKMPWHYKSGGITLREIKNG